MSPGSTTTVDSSSRSSPGMAVMPHAAASPVPRCSNCSTNVMLAHGGASLEIFVVTLLGVMADDHRGRRRPQSLQGIDDVEDHRPAADHVQRLRAIRAHARALAGSENNGSDTHKQGLPRRDADRRQSLRSPATQAAARPLVRWRSLARICATGSSGCSAPGRGIEPLFSGPKPAVLPIERPRTVEMPTVAPDRCGTPGSVADLMGSLIKKRRKRMRKKKHKKMLRRTRHQRRK